MWDMNPINVMENHEYFNVTAFMAMFGGHLCQNISQEWKTYF